MNCALPLLLSTTLVYVAPYIEIGNGSGTLVVQSSQWLPMSVIPGTIDAPEDWAMLKDPHCAATLPASIATAQMPIQGRTPI